MFLKIQSNKQKTYLYVTAYLGKKISENCPTLMLPKGGEKGKSSMQISVTDKKKYIMRSFVEKKEGRFAFMVGRKGPC